MKKIDTLMTARWILPIEPFNQLLEHHSLVINAGKITDILPTTLAMQRYTARKSINLPTHIVMPGLVNAHAHSAMVLFRGLADDLPLMDWLQHYIWPAEQAIINPESVADGTRLAILEMIRSGITCVADHYFFYDVAAEVMADLGMRSCIGTFVIQVASAFAKDEENYLQKAKQSLLKQHDNKHPLIHWAIAPHSIYTVSDHGLRACHALAEEFDLPIHIHLHESAAEIQYSLKKYQKRPIAHFAKLGILTSRMIGVHMVHVNDEDLDLFSAAGASVVHCPESNLKLANGIAPVTTMLKKRINIALGTDGAASNNDLDLFAELRIAALLAKGQSQDPTAISAMTALTMATLHGAKAFGLDTLIGSLKIGKSADIIAIDLNHYITEPVYNPISHLAYAVNRLQVSDVWIAGQHLLHQGEFLNIDVNQVVAQAKRWNKRVKSLF